MISKYGKDIPDFVKKLRDEKELSMEGLGKLLGVSKQYIHQIENGVTKNPASFCALLFPHLSTERANYLMELAHEAATLKYGERYGKQTKRGKTRS